MGYVPPLVETLESRQLLSAAAPVVIDPVPHATGGTVDVDVRAARQRVFLTVDLRGPYSGQIVVPNPTFSELNTLWEITGQVGNAFSGSITIIEGDGSQITSSFSTKVNRNLKFRFSVRGPGTRLTLSGTVRFDFPGGPSFVGTMTGKLGGLRLRPLGTFGVLTRSDNLL